VDILVLVFESTHKVLKAEKLLKSEKIDYEIIPTPKDISSDCGMSVRLMPEQIDIDHIRSCLGDNNIVFKVYKRKM